MGGCLYFLEELSSLEVPHTPGSMAVYFNNEASGKWILNILSPQEIEDEEERALSWTKGLGFVPMLLGKSLTELLAMGDASLWWTQEYWFFLSSTMGFTIPELFKFTLAIKKWIEQTQPKKICFKSPRQELLAVVLELAKNGEIPVEVYPLRKAQTIRNTRPFILEFAKQCKQFARFLVAKFYKPVQVAYKRGGVSILGAAYDADFGQLTDDFGNKLWGNRDLDNLIKQLDREGFSNLWLEREASPRLSVKLLLKKLPKFIPYEGFWTFGIERQVFRQTSHFTTTFRKLSEAAAEQEYFIVSGVNLWPALEVRFKLLFSLRVIESFRNVLLLKRAIKLLQPRVLVITDEGDSYGRAMQIAAREGGVPCVGIQHGFIHPTHFAYFYRQGVLSANGLRPNLCPIPTVTAVYGDYAYKALTESSCYPPESVIKTGAAKFDYLVRAVKYFNRKTILEDLDLQPDLKTITFISQPLPAKGEREEILNIVCASVKELAGVQLVIKLHPAESDFENVRRIMKEHGLNGCVAREYNTHAVLAASELMICKNSTTVLEAALIGCKVMTVNPRGEKEPVPLAGVAGIKEVRSKEQMVVAMKQALSEEGFPRRGELLNLHLFNEDGKATQRILQVIKSLSEVR